MIEDDVYRTSSQFRLWSYTTSSLQSLRATTNAVASERVRAALRRARENHASTTSSAAGTPQPGGDGEPRKPDEKQIECLTPAEELVLVRYYCEKTLELGETYKPPLPTMVRVSSTLREALARYFELTMLCCIPGHRYTVSPPFLSDQFPDDLSSQIHHGLRSLPCDQN